VAKGQQRSNREQKKPKADKNKAKAGATASPLCQRGSRASASTLARRLRDVLSVEHVRIDTAASYGT
jgi:hypothetical protein